MLRRIQLDIIKNILKLILSDFDITCNLSTDFSKNPQILNFIKIRPVTLEFPHADKRPDGCTGGWKAIYDEASSRFP